MRISLKGRWRRRAWLAVVPLLALAVRPAWDSVSQATSLRVYAIPSVSMAPTLTKGDKICAETSRRTTPRRGEVWLFNTPRGATFVKRVVGLPGETIAVEGGRVVVDGRPLDEPYLAGPTSYAMPPVRLEAGEYFMLGDNRGASNDSHLWGPVPEREFIGRALYRCWPAGRWGELR